MNTLNPTEQTAFEILSILPSIMRIIAAELRHSQPGLAAPQLGILSQLVIGSCNLSELAETHVVSLPTMSNTISRMVAQGLVERQQSAQDRRMITLQITPQGRTLLETIVQYFIRDISARLSPLTEEEQTAVRDGMAVLQKIFSKE